MPHTVTDMPHTLMLHTESPLPSATNTSAPQLPLMESTNCTSVKPKLMLNQKLTMADMDTDTPDRLRIRICPLRIQSWLLRLPIRQIRIPLLIYCWTNPVPYQPQKAVLSKRVLNLFES